MSGGRAVQLLLALLTAMACPPLLAAPCTDVQLGAVKAVTLAHDMPIPRYDGGRLIGYRTGDTVVGGTSAQRVMRHGDDHTLYLFVPRDARNAVVDFYDGWRLGLAGEWDEDAGVESPEMRVISAGRASDREGQGAGHYSIRIQEHAVIVTDPDTGSMLSCEVLSALIKLTDDALPAQ